MEAYGFIVWLQSLSTPALDRIVILITNLGHESFYMILLPVLYWCLDRRTGAQLTGLFLFGMWFSFWMKDLLQLPRAFQAHPEVAQLHEEPNLGYGFPSGHAFGSTMIWGFLMIRFRRAWLWAAGTAIIVLVSLSRMYLGLHHLVDILGGAAVALALIGVFSAAAPRIGGILREREALAWLLAASPLLLLPLQPTSDGFKLIGYLVGLLYGYLAVGRRHPNAQAPILHQAAKAVIGLAVLFGLQTLTRPLFPEGGLQVVRYLLLGLWAACAPGVFARLLPQPATPGRAEPLPRG